MSVGGGVAPRRADVLRVLAKHRAELETMGVTSLAVFGSVARDEARPDSDVDVLVEIRRPMGFFGFLAIKQRLEEVLGCPVDLVTPEWLRPPIRERVLADATPVTPAARRA